MNAAAVVSAIGWTLVDFVWQGALHQVFQQLGLQRVARMGGGVDVGTFALVADQQAFAVHHLHQAQDGGIGHVGPRLEHVLMHLLGGGGTHRPQHLQQVEFGGSGLGKVGLARHAKLSVGSDVCRVVGLDRPVYQFRGACREYACRVNASML